MNTITSSTQPVTIATPTLSEQAISNLIRRHYPGLPEAVDDARLRALIVNTYDLGVRAGVAARSQEHDTCALRAQHVALVWKAREAHAAFLRWERVAESAGARMTAGERRLHQRAEDEANRTAEELEAFEAAHPDVVSAFH